MLIKYLKFGFATVCILVVGRLCTDVLTNMLDASRVSDKMFFSIWIGIFAMYFFSQRGKKTDQEKDPD
jgi:hypothetical protein